MTAAFIAQAMDSSPQVIENAAESALEHHLGMTCDPVAGYVQVPCIERCAFGAVKAWIAFMIATNEIASRHRVDLDTTIKTLADTGRDMNAEVQGNERGRAGLWQHDVDVRDFIQRNVTPYDGDESVPRWHPASGRNKVWEKLQPTSRRKSEGRSRRRSPRPRPRSPPISPATSIATTR